MIADEVSFFDRGSTEEKTRPVFITGDRRRVVPVAPFGQDSSGDFLEPEEFFDRAPALVEISILVWNYLKIL